MPRRTGEQTVTTIDTITTDQIEALKDEAAEAGDLRMVRVCEWARAGNCEATSDVVDAIRNAEAAAA